MASWSSFSVAAFPQGKFPCFNNPITGARIVTPECTLQTPLTSPNFSRSNRYHEWAAYFNDSWKVKPRFTLNLGMRYEYYGIQHNADQSLDSNFYLGEGANIFERIANGRILLAQDSPIGKLWKPDKNNFRAAPRICVGRVRRRQDEPSRWIRHGLRAQLRKRHVQRHSEPAQQRDSGNHGRRRCSCRHTSDHAWTTSDRLREVASLNHSPQ